MRRGGRGGGRGGIVADVVGNAMEDLGFDRFVPGQDPMFNSGGNGSDYPPLQIPYPHTLTSSDANLVQYQRILAHRMEHLYQNSQTSSPGEIQLSDNIHVTVPQSTLNSKDVVKEGGDNAAIFVPEELQGDACSQLMKKKDSSKGGLVRPKALERTIESLEARELKHGNKAKADDDDLDDMNDDELDGDLGDDMNDYTVDYYDSDAPSDDGDEELFY